jgi:hypothetical protein
MKWQHQHIPRQMTLAKGWPVQIEPANRNRNVALTCAQRERHAGLCEGRQNWYNGCMNPDVFVEEQDLRGLC